MQADLLSGYFQSGNSTGYSQVFQIGADTAISGVLTLVNGSGTSTVTAQLQGSPDMTNFTDVTSATITAASTVAGTPAQGFSTNAAFEGLSFEYFRFKTTTGSAATAVIINLSVSSKKV